MTAEEPVVRLTIEQAVDYARENSKTLQSSAIDLEIKKRASSYSWNQFMPSVQVTGTMSRKNEVTQMSISIPGYPMPPQPDPTEADHWTAVGSVSVSWNFSAAMIESIRLAKRDYEAGLISWDQTLRQTELQIEKLFYGLLLQEESLKIQQDSLENARLRMEQARINYLNGLIPELSYIQAQVSYQNMKPSVMKQEQLLKQQLDMFGFLIGLPAGTKIELEGAIEPPRIELVAQDLVDISMENNPDILLLNKNLEILKLTYSMQNLQTYIPSLSLSWGFQPVVSDIQENWIDNYTDGGSFSATLVWNLTNMLPFSANQQKAKDTKDNIRKMELSLETLKENTALNIRTQIDNLNQAWANIEAASGNITLAQKSYDMNVTSYQNGTRELLDVKDAESQLNQAKLGLINSKYEYLTGLLDLEYSLNIDLIN
ncbi:MAG: TolC family protein [Candidatus Treponema excrementipullorum]|uniref:TolC family protein n=1 Tax=Candidatus Treponema excrementipullorum TaxID=2838768 RepID=A0A9E2L1F3_9SPIR|nr:TolC family protein [Candidatus Treponema excrementipullorum]